MRVSIVRSSLCTTVIALLCAASVDAAPIALTSGGSHVVHLNGGPACYELCTDFISGMGNFTSLSGSAFGAPGRLGAAANVTVGVLEHPYLPTLGKVAAGATYFDEGYVYGGTEVLVTVRLYGILTGALSNYSTTGTACAASSASLHGTLSIFHNTLAQRYDTCEPGIDSPNWIDVQLLNNGVFRLQATINAYAQAHTPGGPGDSAGAMADGGHTLRIFVETPPGVSIEWGSGHDYSLEVIDAAVPEPATVALFGTGLAALFVARWRRRKPAA